LIIAEIYSEIEEEVQSILEKLEGYYYYHIDENQVFRINKISDISKNAERNFIFCPLEKKGMLSEFID
jgi:regulator of sigma D